MTIGSIFKSPGVGGGFFEDVGVGFYEKKHNDLLTEGKHPIFYRALLNLFMWSHDSKLEAADYFATNAFNHFLGMSNNIYIASDSANNNSVIAYIMADGTCIHQMAVHPKYQKAGIACALLNLLHAKNPNADSIVFLADQIHPRINGYLAQLGFMFGEAGYNGRKHDKSMVRWINKE